MEALDFEIQDNPQQLAEELRDAEMIIAQQRARQLEIVQKAQAQQVAQSHGYRTVIIIPAISPHCVGFTIM